jgi:hypothetical protein
MYSPAAFRAMKARLVEIPLPPKPDACIYCGATDRPLERDHVEPLTRGGEHAPENVVWCCRSCNSSKSDRFLLEWVWAGRAPVCPRPNGWPPLRAGYFYPVRDVVEIRGDDEVLSCGHVRPPRFKADSPHGVDTGTAPKRACYECGEPKPYMREYMNQRGR